MKTGDNKMKSLGYLNKRSGTDVYSWEVLENGTELWAQPVEKNRRGEVYTTRTPFRIIRRFGKYGFWRPVTAVVRGIDNRFTHGQKIKAVDGITFKNGAKVIQANMTYFAVLDENGRYKRTFETLGLQIDEDCKYYWDPEF